MEFLGKKVKTRLELIGEGEVHGDAQEFRLPRTETREESKYLFFKDKTLVLSTDGAVTHTVPEACTYIAQSQVLRSPTAYYYPPNYQPVKLPGLYFHCHNNYIVTREDNKQVVHVHDIFSGETHKLLCDVSNLTYTDMPLLITVNETPNGECEVRCMLTNKKLMARPAKTVSIVYDMILVTQGKHRSYFRVTREVKESHECLICHEEVKKITKTFPCGHSMFCEECTPTDCPNKCGKGPLIKLFT
jgi:hypothetical protein